MARKKRQEEGAGNGWLATYGDMVTLLLTFFVLLFAFSSIDVVKFQKMLVSFRGATGFMDGGKTLEDSPNVQGGKPAKDAGEARRQSRHLLEITRQVQTLVNDEGLQNQVFIHASKRGVTISLADQLLFPRGGSDLAPGGKRVLYKLGVILQQVSVPVIVEGHTDTVPLRGGPYKDNWGLSAIRASTVVSYLEKEAGISSLRLMAVGYGQHKPLVPNDEERHQALNRRVDLVLRSQYFDHQD